MAIRKTQPWPAISAGSAPEWDDLVTAASNGHLLQSFRWGEFKARHGWAVERFSARDNGGFAAAQVLWHASPLGDVGYIPRGPVIVPSDNVPAARRLMEAIHQAARRRGAVFLKVEPNQRDAGPLPELGFRQSSQSAQPRATLVVDLTADLDTLLSRMHPKTRYNIRLAQKKGVQVVRGDSSDIPAFRRIMQETCQRHGISMRPLGYYRDILTVLGENAELLLATHEGELLAGILIAKFNGEAIYLYGASTSQKRNLMPSYLLQWETMRRAKAHGLLRYDLWAVPPELATQAERVDSGMSGANDLPVARQDAAQGLWGVYRFKRGFGGRLVAYCGAYDYVYNLPSYTLWQRLAPPLIDLLGRARTQSTVLLSRLLRR